MAEAFRVDAVADACGKVPFDRHAERGEALGGLEQGLGRDQVVATAMDQRTGGRDRTRP